MGKFVVLLAVATTAWVPPAPAHRPAVAVRMGRGSRGMAREEVDRSRRQSRVAQLVRSELATVIRDGAFLVKTGDRVDAEVLKSTSVLDVSVSPDLRAATATITTLGDTSAKREAFSWLVKNERSVRYALAKRLKHSKRVPAVTFRKADVSAATKLMDLIDARRRRRRRRRRRHRRPRLRPRPRRRGRGGRGGGPDDDDFAALLARQAARRATLGGSAEGDLALLDDDDDELDFDLDLDDGDGDDDACVTGFRSC
ncbi:ribosome-binding factor A [Aureococcus anophagefferens]|nr:ribosome-binding factor A [Aureococcus anophagefferens]